MLENLRTPAPGAGAASAVFPSLLPLPRLPCQGDLWTLSICRLSHGDSWRKQGSGAATHQANPGTGWESGRGAGDGLGFIRIIEVGQGARWPRETLTLQVTDPDLDGDPRMRVTEPAAQGQAQWLGDKDTEQERTRTEGRREGDSWNASRVEIHSGAPDSLYCEDKSKMRMTYSERLREGFVFLQNWWKPQICTSPQAPTGQKPCRGLGDLPH